MFPNCYLSNPEVLGEADNRTVNMTFLFSWMIENPAV